MRAIELILGIRRDLALDSRWWHRLAQVSLVVLAAACVTVATRALHVRPEISTGNVRVIDNLRDYTLRYADEVDPVFLFDFIGRTAVIAPGGEVSQVFGLRSNVFCNARADELMQYLVALKDHPHLGDILAAKHSKVHLGSKTHPEAGCVIKASFEENDPSKIVRVEVTGMAKVWAWLKAAALAAGIAALLAVVACNVYWRGLIYIAFGPRKRVA
jgi:hypothetical protein